MKFGAYMEIQGLSHYLKYNIQKKIETKFISLLIESNLMVQ